MNFSPSKTLLKDNLDLSEWSKAPFVFNVGPSMADTRFGRTMSTSPVRAADIAATMKPKEKNSRRYRVQWTAEEDTLLFQAVTACGDEEIKWKELLRTLGLNRTSKQSRDRWFNHLRPGIKKGKWTRSEEKLLAKLYQTFGPKWAAMGKIMEGRSDNDIKNRWYAMARHEQRIEKVVRASLQKPQTARSTTIPASAPLNLSRLDPGDPDTKAYVAQPSKRQRTNSGTRSTLALHESVQV